MVTALDKLNEDLALFLAIISYALEGGISVMYCRLSHLQQWLLLQGRRHCDECV